MSHRLALLGWLVLVWLALWGEVSVANVASGAAVGAVVIASFPRAGPERVGPLRPLWGLVFVGYFLYEIVEATLTVAWEVITPRSGIREGIVAVPVTPGTSDAVVTIVANAISLTPGTLTVEVGEDPRTLFVHVLHLGDVHETRMDILRLEWFALRAFGRREVLAQTTRPSKRQGLRAESTRARLHARRSGEEDEK